MNLNINYLWIIYTKQYVDITSGSKEIGGQRGGHRNNVWEISKKMLTTFGAKVNIEN